MVLLQQESWRDGYEDLLHQCRSAAAAAAGGGIGGSSPGKTLILCHADVDAMAAARILTYMLRADQIEYVLEPCPTYRELREKLLPSNFSTSSSSLQDPYAAVVLLNVGGTRNLSRLFGSASSPVVHTNDDDSTLKQQQQQQQQQQQRLLDLETTRLYVLDSRRPLHLANIYAGNHIQVFWDATQGSPEDLPSDGDNLSANESDAEQNSDEESSSEDNDDEDEDIRGLSDTDEEEDDDDDDDDGEMEMDFDDHVQRNSRSADRIQERRPDDDDDDDVFMEDPDADYDAEDEGNGRRTPQKKDKKKKTNRREQQEQESQPQDSPGNETVATEGLDDDDDDQDADEDPFNATSAQGTTMNTSSQADVDKSMVLHPLSPAERHRRRQDKLRLYYSNGSSYGWPASCMCYNMAQQLRFAQVSDLLWLCMIGVTDGYLQGRLEKLAYAQLATALQETCRQIYPEQDSVERASNTVYAEELMGNGTNPSQTRLTFSEHGRIKPQRDFRFFLLRHSSLLDSLYLSPYVSTTLQLWTKPGIQRLYELLARMGYPQEECKQPFRFMKPSLKRQLHDKFMEFAEEFGLDELEFTSFARVTGFKSSTSASDICYAASALLECPIISASDSQSKTTEKSGEVQQEELSRECFLAAYDALGSTPNFATSLTGRNSRKTSDIDTGVQWAVKLQRLILTQAVSLVARNAITRLRHFRYAYITCSSQAGNGGGGGGAGMAANPQDMSSSSSAADQQYNVLAKPLALTRLASYLMDMHRANGKWVGEKNARPLVLLAEQPATGTYLVVGYEMPEQHGLLPKNKFGQYFELVAQTMNHSNNEANDESESQVKAVARLDSFDAHVVEVASTHAQRFLEQLHYILDSA